MSHASPRPGAPTFPISQAHYQQHQQQLQQQQMLQHQQQQQQAMQHQQLLQAQQQQQALQAQQQHALPPQQPRVPMAVHAPQQTPQQQHYSPMPSSLPPRAAGGGAPMPPRHAAPALPSQNGLLHASARAEKRERMPKDGGEREWSAGSAETCVSTPTDALITGYYLRGGPSNFLLLSLRSGLPSHIDWALARLLDASLNHADRFTWEKWPGLTDTLLRFPMRVVAAVKGAPETEWAPRFFETEEQADADEALGWTSAPPMLGVTRPAKRQRADETALPGTSRLGALSTGAGAFRPAQDDSHAALARWAVLASTILRNLSLHGSFVRHMYTHTRGMPTLIADVLTLDCLALEADAWAELEALREMRGIWLDVCESVAPMLIFSPPADAPAPLVAAGKANMKAAELAGDAILGAVVSFIVHAEDRQLLVASLRIIGVLAELERNEHLFASGRPIYPEGPTVQAVVQRCAQLVALDASADPALVESALDCLYQLLRIDGFNALRLAADGVVISHKPAAQDAFGLVRLLVRCLACRRVSWPRTHNIQVHPQLHAGIPTRRALEEQERRARFAGLAPEQAAAKEASNRWLTKWEVQRVAGLPEPERLTTWCVHIAPTPCRFALTTASRLKMIYEPRAKSEVTQVELWETYRDQFTPYSQHGTPTAVQPAAEVIRIASVAFPGATAMVQNGTRFVITGVARRDRSCE
jgi:chromatin structure-remodeling complex subunit RSC9